MNMNDDHDRYQQRLREAQANNDPEAAQRAHQAYQSLYTKNQQQTSATNTSLISSSAAPKEANNQKYFVILIVILVASFFAYQELSKQTQAPKTGQTIVINTVQDVNADCRLQAANRSGLCLMKSFPFRGKNYLPSKAVSVGTWNCTLTPAVAGNVTTKNVIIALPAGIDGYATDCKIQDTPTKPPIS